MKQNTISSFVQEYVYMKREMLRQIEKQAITIVPLLFDLQIV